MQALVRVQARVRARRVRLALEDETSQQKHQQQLADEARVREIEVSNAYYQTRNSVLSAIGLCITYLIWFFWKQEGWCDGIGSVEQIQAKIMQRQEAAAKRERAMAYALAHQWQAGSRQQAAHSGFVPDKNSWGWNWLERWMAVRPWENRFLDIRDGVMVGENEPDDKPSKAQQVVKSTTTVKKKPNVQQHQQPNGSSQKTGPSHSEGASNSPPTSKSAGGMEATSNTHSTKKLNSKPKPAAGETGNEAKAQTGNPQRSLSNPKERSSRADQPAKKRLSLPNRGVDPAKQGRPNAGAVRVSPAARKATIKSSKPDSNNSKSSS
ncbi:Protein IQ-DOMAIN 5 [Linum perenne]